MIINPAAGFGPKLSGPASPQRLSDQLTIKEVQMSTFDVACGMSAAALNKGVGQLYARPEVRQKLFRGSKAESTALGAVTLTWDILAAPAFILTPPTAGQWQKAQKKQAGGKDVPQPAANGFQVRFSQFNASYSVNGGTGVAGTTDLRVYATVNVRDDLQQTDAGAVILSVAGIGLDETKFSQWDRLIFNKILLPQLFTTTDQMLGTVKFRNLAYKGVELAHPAASITDDMLVVAAVLNTKSATDLSGAVWPRKSVFTLLSPDLIQKAAAVYAKTLVGPVGKPGTGKYLKVFDYQYRATVSQVDMAVDGSTLPKISAKINGTATGSCSVKDCPVASGSALM
jgi:hypothetical protein